MATRVSTGFFTQDGQLFSAQYGPVIGYSSYDDGSEIICINVYFEDAKWTTHDCYAGEEYAQFRNDTEHLEMVEWCMSDNGDTKITTSIYGIVPEGCPL